MKNPHAWVAYCHMCALAHPLWATGDTWQCQRCLFSIPAVHVWWWCPIEIGATVQEHALTQMELF